MIWELSEVSRHKSLDTLRGYVRRVDLFKEHAGAAFLVTGALSPRQRLIDVATRQSGRLW